MALATEPVASTLFAAPVQTGDAMAARVRRDLERDFTDGPPPGIDLAVVAQEAVAGLAGARVKAFVPVLALRAAREALAEAGV